MQYIDRMELLRTEKALRTSTAKSTAQASAAQSFAGMAKRLVRDVETKGTARTAVETIHLALHANSSEKSSAECFCTYPRAIYPSLHYCAERRKRTNEGPAHRLLRAYVPSVRSRVLQMRLQICSTASGTKATMCRLWVRSRCGEIGKSSASAHHQRSPSDHNSQKQGKSTKHSARSSARSRSTSPACTMQP